MSFGVTFGDRLRATRTRHLWTQLQLAKRAKVCREDISRYENDRVMPRFSTIRRLARVLHVDEVWLFTGKQGVKQ